MRRIFSEMAAVLCMAFAMALWLASPVVAGVLEDELLEESILEEELAEEEELAAETELMATETETGLTELDRIGMADMDLGDLEIPLPECDCVMPSQGVRIFGSLRPALAYSDETHDHNFATTPETDSVNVTDFESVLGVEVNRAINDDINVFGMVEMDASMGDSNSFGDLSQAFMGFESKNASFSIGSQRDPYFTMIAAPTDHFNDAFSPLGFSGWSGGALLGDFLRDSTSEYSTDLLKYEYRIRGLSLFAGLQANGHQLTIGGNDSDSDSENSYVDAGTLGLRWTGGGFHFSVAYREERRGDYNSNVRHSGTFSPYGYQNLALNANERGYQDAARVAAATAVFAGQAAGNYRLPLGQSSVDHVVASNIQGTPNSASRTVTDDFEKRFLGASLGVELTKYLYLGFSYQSTRLSIQNARMQDTYSWQASIRRDLDGDGTYGDNANLAAIGIVPGALPGAQSKGKTADAVLIVKLPDEGVRLKAGYFEYDDGDAFNGRFSGYLMAIEKDLAKNAYIFAQLRHLELENPQLLASSTLTTGVLTSTLGSLSIEGSYDVLSIGIRYDFDLTI